MKKIISELEKSSGTFSEILERTKLSRSTLSTALRELDAGGYIERKVELTEKEGRKKSFRVVIQLKEKKCTPVESTLRHLENLTTHELDLEKTRELLTDDVIETVLVISSLNIKFIDTPKTPSCFHSSALTCYKDLTEESKKFLLKHHPWALKFELDEWLLLKALARFYTELGCIKYPEQFGSKTTTLLKCEKNNPSVFPAIAEAKRFKTVNQMKKLLELIRPNWEAEVVGGIEKMVLNLGSFYFMLHEEGLYFQNVLRPLWNMKSRSFLSKGKR